MKNNLNVKKLYLRLSDEEIKRKSIVTLICSVATLVCASVILIIPQSGPAQMEQIYPWAKMTVVGLAVANLAAALFCFAGHFTLYRLKKEIYAARLPVLRGEWHTFAGLELQFVLSAAFTLLELFMLVRWFDAGTLCATAVAATGTACAWTVRSITFKAFKNLGEVSLAEHKSENVLPDGVEDIRDNDETDDFYGDGQGEEK